MRYERMQMDNEIMGGDRNRRWDLIRKTKRQFMVWMANITEIDIIKKNQTEVLELKIQCIMKNKI